MSNIETFKLGMRRLAAGVSVVTTMENSVPYGIVATAVTSVSADPKPVLLVCVNKSASLHGQIERKKILCVNVLSVGDCPLARRFSSSANREDRFAECTWESLETGAPALVGALASFDCQVTDVVPVQSHTIFICEVVAMKIWRDDIHPLIYVNGNFAALDSQLTA